MEPTNDTNTNTGGTTDTPVVDIPTTEEAPSEANSTEAVNQ